MTTPDAITTEQARAFAAKLVGRRETARVIRDLAAQVDDMWTELNKTGLPELAMCPACLEEVSMTQCDQLTQDAKRYRWLRKQHWSNGELAVVRGPKHNVKLGTICPSGEMLDFDIDAEIAKESAIMKAEAFEPLLTKQPA